MEWINSYLSCRYEDGARGPEKFDCWGLVRDARHRHQGMRLLPSWGHVRNTEPKEFTRAYRNEAEHMEVCQPEPGAIAAVMRGHICVHVALVVGTRGQLKILEINPYRGARCMLLHRWARENFSVIYYRDRQ
jgi:hypothetical protein